MSDPLHLPRTDVLPSAWFVARYSLPGRSFVEFSEKRSLLLAHHERYLTRAATDKDQVEASISYHCRGPASQLAFTQKRIGGQILCELFTS
jgi:hypothetical protein